MSDVTYTNEIIENLNDYGILSVAYLARKYRMNFQYALFILKEIVEDYENVEFKTKHRIYIIDREDEELKKIVKKVPIINKKKSKYRRIIKC